MTFDWKTPGLAGLAVAAAVLLLAARSWTPAASEFVVEADVTSSRAGTAQLYFDSGASYSERHSASQPIPLARTRSTLRFPLAPGTYRALRFDPPENAGAVVLHALVVTDSGGKVIRRVPLAGATAGPEIATLNPTADGLAITTRDGATDPQLELLLSPELTLSGALWKRWGPHPAWALLTAALLAGAFLCLTRSPGTPATRGQRFGLGASLFLVVWGARLALIDRYGTDLPYWDQWDKEGMRTFVPWSEGHRFWTELFAPFNEHRVVPTALLNLLLVKAGGAWDARVQCAVNAALLASALVLLAEWLGRGMSLGRRILLTLTLAALFALPLAWENILGGFQSQFTFLAAFSVLGMAGMLVADPFTWRWWGGMAAGAAALVSMGSGFLWAVPGVAGTMLLARLGQAGRRTVVANTAAGAAFLGLGLWLRTSPESLVTLHARDAGEFVGYAARCLALPFPDAPLAAPLLWLPWCGLLVRSVCRPPAGAETDRTAVLLLAFGGWILLQAAAVAYGRGASPGFPPSRYADLFALGALVNLACGLRLARTAAWRTGAAVYFGAVATGAIVLATTLLASPIPARAQDYGRYVAAVRAYLADHDLQAFLRRPLPFPDGPFLAHALDHPVLQPLLPASVTPPPVHVTPLSRIATALAGQGTPLMFAGLVPFLLLLPLTGRAAPRPAAGDGG